MKTMEPNVTPIAPMADISSIADGSVYELSRLTFQTPNVFTSLAFTESLVVKLPTRAWKDDFALYVQRGESPLSGYPCVRLADAEERNVENLLAQFPDFRGIHAQNVIDAHFLLVHKLQYERLCRASKRTIRIPQSRFIIALKRTLLFFSTRSPAVIQERVAGTPLLEMVEDHVDAIIPKWQPFLPKINPRLHELLSSDLTNHLNWYIRNFIYDPKTDILWYVDPKPTCLFAGYGNERNIQGLHNVFSQYD